MQERQCVPKLLVAKDVRQNQTMPALNDSGHETNAIEIPDRIGITERGRGVGSGRVGMQSKAGTIGILATSWRTCTGMRT